MTNPVSRSQAKKWTIGAQLASVVFVLGAVTLGVVGLPTPKTDAPVNPTGGVIDKPGMSGYEAPKVNPSQEVEDDQFSVVDTIGLAARFALLDNAPKPKGVVDSTPPQGPTDPDPEPGNPEIIKRVRYIGFINDAQNPHAFIRIDGKQRVVTRGGIAKAGDETMSDLTVERITPKNIVLTDGESRTSVELAGRTGQSITMVSGQEVEVTPAAQNGSLLTAEDEATIAALPARQQPSARRRLERERRGLSAERENRRPTPQPKKTVRSNFNNNRSQNN
jgi:hypothetical protein